MGSQFTPWNRRGSLSVLESSHLFRDDASGAVCSHLGLDQRQGFCGVRDDANPDRTLRCVGLARQSEEAPWYRLLQHYTEGSYAPAPLWYRDASVMYVKHIVELMYQCRRVSGFVSTSAVILH
jgi:hypothetical protein